jgi:hypothetical protein
MLRDSDDDTDHFVRQHLLYRRRVGAPSSSGVKHGGDFSPVSRPHASLTLPAHGALRGERVDAERQLRSAKRPLTPRRPTSPVFFP